MHACMHARLRVPSQEKMQAPSFKSLYEEVEFRKEQYYAKMHHDKAEAFEKLYSSAGSSYNLPKMPPNLEEEQELSLGGWIFGDPSIMGYKSFLVSKFDRMSPELAAKLEPIAKFEKIVMAVAVVVLAMVAKVLFDDFSKFLEVLQIVVQFGIFMAFLKLVKFVQILEFIGWKLLGTLFKLEFSQICSGGNMNKQLSTVWSKLSHLEKRKMEERADDMDTGRTLTNYLKEFCSCSVEYVQEGVRRQCQSWVESRKRNKDLEESEFGAAWEKIRDMAFVIAKVWFEEEILKAEKNNYTEDLVRNKELLKRLEHVRTHPVEKVEDY